MKLVMRGAAIAALVIVLGALVDRMLPVHIAREATGHRVDGEADCFSAEARLPEYVQVREMRLSWATETHRAWRVHSDDRVEAGSWDDQGTLLDVSQTALVVAGLFERATRAAAVALPGESSPWDGTLGRPAYSVTVAAVLDGKTQSRTWTDAPEPISGLLREFHALIQPMVHPAPGHYLCLEPMGRPPERARDLDSPRACRTPEAGELARAILKGSLVTALGPRTPGAQEPDGSVSVIRARGGWFRMSRVDAGP